VQALERKRETLCVYRHPWDAVMGIWERVRGKIFCPASAVRPRLEESSRAAIAIRCIWMESCREESGFCSAKAQTVIASTLFRGSFSGNAYSLRAKLHFDSGELIAKSIYWCNKGCFVWSLYFRYANKNNKWILHPDSNQTYEISALCVKELETLQWFLQHAHQSISSMTYFNFWWIFGELLWWNKI